MEDNFSLLLREIQLDFIRLYKYHNTNDIRDFLVTRETLTQLAKREKDLGLITKLDDYNIVGFQEYEDSASPYVYFNLPDQMRISEQYPYRTFNDGNVNLFLNLVAKVALFQHLCYLLESDMPVSRFHLAMQNEIDKSVFSYWMFHNSYYSTQMPVMFADRLVFPSLNNGRRRFSIDQETIDAKRYAYHFLEHLYTNHTSEQDYSGFERKVMNFFIQTQSWKVSEINRIH